MTHDNIEFVTVTFMQQKNNKKEEARTQQRSGDPILCPVLASVYLVRKILSHPKLSEKTTINTCPADDDPKGMIYFSQGHTNNILRSTCAMQPTNTYGYSHKDLGSHSIRSGAAMSLFLAKESVHRIMILGRWSSDAFLVYIRPQVQEWTSGLSKSMLQNETFHHQPNVLIPNQGNNQISSDDPLTRNNPHSFASNLDKKPESYNGSNQARFTVPKLHLHY